MSFIDDIFGPPKPHHIAEPEIYGPFTSSRSSDEKKTRRPRRRHRESPPSSATEELTIPTTSTQPSALELAMAEMQSNFGGGELVECPRGVFWG